MNINTTRNTRIEVIEESENEGTNIIKSNGKKANDSVHKINEKFNKSEIDFKKNWKNGNKNQNCNFNIPESCSLSQTEFLLNANNPQYRNTNGIRFKEEHTGNTLNTYESLVGNFLYYFLF